jgi:hypothetical protein
MAIKDPENILGLIWIDLLFQRNTYLILYPSGTREWVNDKNRLSLLNLKNPQSVDTRTENSIESKWKR